MSLPLTSSPAAVLFDLDGTLLDTAPDFFAVLQQMGGTTGRPAPAYDRVHATVSNGARALVRMAYGIEDSHPDFESLLENLLTRYLAQIAVTASQLYPGMETLLRTLEARSIPWGVVTNKASRYSIPLLDKLGLEERCGVLVCPDHVTHTKPHPEPLFLACQQLGVAPEQSVYVGDHPRDIEAGRAAGMTTIAVSYGYLPDTPDIREWGADLIADSADALLKLLPRA